MNTECLSQKEAVRVLEAQIKGTVTASWLCLGAAALFALFGLNAFWTALCRDEADWVPFATMSSLTLLCAGLAVVARCFVVRDRKLLVRLQAIVTQEDAPEHLGVWPPPPRKPKR